MVASSVVCTILVLNYHHRLAVDNSMPQWFRALFLQWIPWLLRMSRPGNKITRRTIYLQNKVSFQVCTPIWVILIMKNFKIDLICTMDTPMNNPTYPPISANNSNDS